MTDDDSDKTYLSLVFEDIRELDDATQRDLLRAWPFPLRLPHCNLSGIDSTVVVLRRIFSELPTDSFCREVIFGKRDRNTFGEKKEELDRFRAIFRYAWHHLPDLASCDPESTLLPLEVMDRQRSLLDVLLPDRRMDQSRISFEALMESELMRASFWARNEFQPFRDVAGWQEKGKTAWETRQRSAIPGPIIWKRDQEPSLEEKMNKILGFREVGGGNTLMLLPNWPACLRVKMVTAAPMRMEKMTEQHHLRLRGFELLADGENTESYKLCQTNNKYYLAAAVAMRSSPRGHDVVVTGDVSGMEVSPLAEDSGLGRAAHEPPDNGNVLAKEGMLYYVLLHENEGTDDVSMSGNSDGDGESELTDDQKFRKRLRALDPGADTGLTPLSMEAEAALPKKISRAHALAEDKFFG